MPKYIVPLTLAALACLALVLRVAGQLDKVFTPDGVMFHDPDSYYYLWLCDQFLAGHPGNYSPLVYMVAGVARLFGGTEYAMEIVAAWYPPTAGALLIIPVYFLGVAVFESKFVGLLGAFLVAVLPTVLFQRSLLGDFDHHVLETLLTTVILLCAVQLLKGKRLLWLAAGLVALGAYFRVWPGAALIVGVLVAYTSVLAVLAVAHRQPGSGDYFALAAVVAIGGLVMYSGQIQSVLNSPALFLTGSVTRWGISEAQPFPLLSLIGSFGIYFLPFAVAGMVWHHITRASGLFLFWSVIMTTVTVLQARWGYYSAVPVALYAAYFIWRVSRKLAYGEGEVLKRDFIQHIVAGALVVIPLLLSLPTIACMINLPVDITPDWYAATKWLRYNTPATGGIHISTTRFVGDSVLSWWDYGYWIQRVGHRAPVVDPGRQSAVPEASRFFTATSEDSARAAIKDLSVRYVLVNKRMVTDMYWVMALDAGASADTLSGSAAYRLYYDGEFAGFKLVEEFGEVKIFGTTFSPTKN